MDAKLLRRAKRRDRTARWVITGGGFLIILSVIGIFFQIASVAIPLFFEPTANPLAQFALGPDLAKSGILAIGTDEYLENAFILNAQAEVAFLPARKDGAPVKLVRIEHPAKGSQQLVAVELSRNLDYSLTWADGWSTLERLEFNPSFDTQSKRSLTRKVTRLAAIPPTANAPPPLLSQVRIEEEGRATRAALLSGNKLEVTQLVRSENLLGDVEESTHKFLLKDPIPGEINVLTLDETGKNLFVGTRNGYLLWWKLAEPGEAELKESILAFDDRRVLTALTIVLGDTSLAVGDERGGLSIWFSVNSTMNGGEKTLRQVHSLKNHGSAVLSVLPSRKSRSLASLDADGVIHFYQITTNNPLLSTKASRPIRAMGLSTRFNGVVGWDGRDTINLWALDIPHPEAGWKTYFGRIWYESYDAASFVWQSSAGTDEYEPKLSLVPLILGTIKATFYGMLFAVPLAVLGAMYTSHLMRPNLRRLVKPTIEIMGSVPSVVIGFLAALWLAPILKVSLVGLLILLGLIPVLGMITAYAWEMLVARFPGRMPNRGLEFAVFLPILFLFSWGGIYLGIALEGLLFNGDFTGWLGESLGTRYDQRNSIVIAFALGFAVLPIIFTISDDALTNVPRNLTAASLALGASRWQTVWRVVLPSASPGIFAAVMIGFGRAIGETMIVLMATGNTPILDWSMLNGMRTLSANIAVETPEAPVGGTLYRTLFLSALLLFMVTFALNSIAELVRQRLRKKYGRY